MSGHPWIYDPEGQLIRWKNKREKDPKWKCIACSWTPPTSQTWISPVEMNKYHYMTIWGQEINKKQTNRVKNDEKRNT